MLRRAVVVDAFAPLLSKSPAPRIVNVTSIAGSLAFCAGLDSAMLVGYASSYAPVISSFNFMRDTETDGPCPGRKAALNMITVQYSKELISLNPKFKINAGCPGPVKTAGNNYSTSVRSLISMVYYDLHSFALAIRCGRHILIRLLTPSLNLRPLLLSTPIPYPSPPLKYRRLPYTGTRRRRDHISCHPPRRRSQWRRVL